jgi:hypothetical protein
MPFFVLFLELDLLAPNLSLVGLCSLSGMSMGSTRIDLTDHSHDDEEDMAWIKRAVSSLIQNHPLSDNNTSKEGESSISITKLLPIPVSLISLIIEYALSFESIACSLESHVANLYPFASPENEQPLHHYKIPSYLLDDRSNIRRLSRLAFHYWKLAVRFDYDDSVAPILLPSSSPAPLPTTTGTNSGINCDDDNTEHGSGGSGWSNYRLGMYYLYGLNGCHQINRSIGISLMRMAYHRGIYRSAAVIAHEIGDEWKQRNVHEVAVKQLMAQLMSRRNEATQLGLLGLNVEMDDNDQRETNEISTRINQCHHQLSYLHNTINGDDRKDKEMIKEAIQRWKDPLTMIWNTLKDQRVDGGVYPVAHKRRYDEFVTTLSNMASPPHDVLTIQHLRKHLRPAPGSTTVSGIGDAAVMAICAK